MSDDPNSEAELELRAVSCDLAEAWVERVAASEGFEVWEEDEDTQSFTEEAQERFDRASDRIEAELRFYRESRAKGQADALEVLIEALGKYADAAAVRAAAKRLA